MPVVAVGFAQVAGTFGVLGVWARVVPLITRWRARWAWKRTIRQVHDARQRGVASAGRSGAVTGVQALGG